METGVEAGIIHGGRRKERTKSLYVRKRKLVENEKRLHK